MDKLYIFEKMVYGVMYHAKGLLDVGPLFFELTVDDFVYRELFQQFVALLEVNERYSWSQQDGAI